MKAVLCVLLLCVAASSASFPSTSTNQTNYGIHSSRPHWQVAEGNFTEIVKSKSDPRHYLRTTLANGLDVLLISDNQTIKASAAMDVNQGYWGDPADIPGLAHFCEHMLFLGNKKYPKEDSYSGFLSAHGGSSNAYTSSGNTNFFFDVVPGALEGALDRFSQFFIAPLFTVSATSREMMAVNAEHVKNLQSDSWRTFQMVQSLAKPSHPFHKFGTGDKHTLGSVDSKKLRSELLSFWKKNYVAQNMRLVILGAEPLDVLLQYAQKYFKEVPSAPQTPKFPLHPVKTKFVDTSKEIFEVGSLPTYVHSKSIKDSRNLMLMWFLPPQTPFYYTKALDYVSDLIGNEGPGSLLSVLKKRGLVNKLTAGPDLTTTQFDLFQIDLELTHNGTSTAAINEIVNTVFQYVRLIEQQGVQEWRWREMGKMSSIKFQLKNKEDAQQYTSDLASKMGKYYSRDLLMANYMYKVYDSKLIQFILSRIEPEGMFMIYSSQKPSVKLDRKEKYYGTQFAVQPVNGQDVLRWKATRTGPANTTHLGLPERNPFIPKSLSVKSVENKAFPDFPVIINETNGTRAIRVWYKQDLQFKRPRANLVCKFWSSQVYSTPRDVVLASMYTKLVRDGLSEVSYPASRAGFSYSYNSDVDGFDFRVAGYDSGLREFIHKIASFLSLKYPGNQGKPGFTPTADRFNHVKEELMQSYVNFMFGQPHVHSAYGASMLLESPHWHISQYITALKRVSLADVIAWSRGVFQDISVECLAHGNLYKREAISIVDAFTSQLQFKSNAAGYNLVSNQIQRIVQLDGAYEFTMKTPNAGDLNSAAYTYYQYEGEGSIKDDLLTQLLARVMEKPAFHQLRTVEQLGYIVWSGLDVREGVNGIRILVQSPKRTAKYLNSRILHLMTLVKDIVDKMPGKEFTTLVETMRRIKQQKSRTLAERTSKFWYEISTQQYLFDRQQQEIAALGNFTQPMFKQFFNEIAGYGQVKVPSRLSIEVQSQLTSHVDGAPKGEHIRSGSSTKTTTAPVPKRKAEADTLEIKAALKADSAEARDLASELDADSFIQLEHVESGKLVMLRCPDSKKNVAVDPRCLCASVPASQPCQGWKLKAQVGASPSSSGSQTQKPKAPLHPVAPPIPAGEAGNPYHDKGTTTVSYKKVPCGNGQVYEDHSQQCKDSKPPAPVFQPHTGDLYDNCNKSGPKRVYSARDLNLRTIATFKDAMCLFPKRPIGKLPYAKDFSTMPKATVTKTAPSL